MVFRTPASSSEEATGKPVRESLSPTAAACPVFAAVAVEACGEQRANEALADGS
ncbi:hypothetical protein AAHB37_13375 [Glutamicibacter halophytocola]|uniref:hypothetical protein n=1 Tax=Glutamicibacter halophytocola TaxID=1933880 RepID=UPI00321BCCA6